MRSVPPRDSHIQHYIRTTELALQKTHEAARQVGKPVATQALKDQKKAAEEQVEHHILSDCPLAADHLHQVRNCSISFAAGGQVISKRSSFAKRRNRMVIRASLSQLNCWPWPIVLADKQQPSDLLRWLHTVINLLCMHMRKLSALGRGCRKSY